MHASNVTTLGALCVASLGLATCKSAAPTPVALGSVVYHASPDRCHLDKATTAAVELPDHYKAKDGKGLVFRADAVGQANVVCDHDGRTHPYRAHEVERLALELAHRDEPIIAGDRVLIRLAAHASEELTIGGYTSGIEWSTSPGASLSPESHPIFCCTAYQQHFRFETPGPHWVTATWRTKRARLDIQVARSGSP